MWDNPSEQNEVQEFPSAEDLINSVPASQRHSKTYNRILEKILRFKEDLVKNKTIYCYPHNDEDFHDWELDEIRNKGYNCDWDSACLWYEVSLSKFNI